MIAGVAVLRNRQRDHRRVLLQFLSLGSGRGPDDSRPGYLICCEGNKNADETVGLDS